MKILLFGVVNSFWFLFTLAWTSNLTRSPMLASDTFCPLRVRMQYPSQQSPTVCSSTYCDHSGSHNRCIQYLNITSTPLIHHVTWNNGNHSRTMEFCWLWNAQRFLGKSRGTGTLSIRQKCGSFFISLFHILNKSIITARIVKYNPKVTNVVWRFSEPRMERKMTLKRFCLNTQR